jgi:hypothetical protein
MTCMNATGTLEKYATCVTLDVPALDLSGTRTALADVLACRARLDHLLARLSAHADVLAAGPEPDGPGSEQLLRRARLTNHGASVIASRSRLLSVLPAFADALADGSIHAEHLDALVPIVRDIDPQKLPEFTDPSIIDGLLAIARQSTPKELAKEARSVAAVVDIRLGETEAERIHRQRRVRFVRHRDGTTSITGHLGVHGDEARRLVEQETNRHRAAQKDLAPEDRSTDDQMACDALLALLRGGATNGGVDTPVSPAFIVKVGVDDLVKLFEHAGPGATTTAGVPLTAEYARQLFTHTNIAGIIPVLLDQRGLPMELAKAARQRLANLIQRAVLSTMYDTCAVPGCDVPFDDCDIHHLTEFDGTNTTLSNEAPICRHDHREHHNGRRRITLGTDRSITITLPDGSVWAKQTYQPPDHPRRRPEHPRAQDPPRSG